VPFGSRRLPAAGPVKGYAWMGRACHRSKEAAMPDETAFDAASLVTKR